MDLSMRNFIKQVRMLIFQYGVTYQRKRELEELAQAKDVLAETLAGDKLSQEEQGTLRILLKQV